MKTDNELIAEFMGAEEWTFSQGEKGHSFWNKDSDGRRGWFPDGSTNKLPDEFKYDTSWDWLIPVAQKIKHLPALDHPDFFDRRASVTQQTICQEITVVYIRVVEFIKWYNKQTK